MMSLISHIFHLQTLKDELIEKQKLPSTTYSQMLEINHRLRLINLQIQELRGLQYSKK
ncbi:hypothetical protein ABLT31_17500 [Ammoniphilus sp. 3BR4]